MSLWRKVESMLKIRKQDCSNGWYWKWAWDSQEPKRLGRERQTRGEPAPKGGGASQQEKRLVDSNHRGIRWEGSERVCRGAPKAHGPLSVKGQGSKDRITLSEARQPPRWGGRRGLGEYGGPGDSGKRGKNHTEPVGRAPVHCTSDRAESSVTASGQAAHRTSGVGPLRAAALSASSPRASAGHAGSRATRCRSWGRRGRAPAGTHLPPSRSLYLGL